jgi:hypothetical protein
MRPPTTRLATNALVSVLLLACGSTAATPADAGAAVPAPGADAGAVVASCSDAPLGDACIGDESASLFVSPTGSDVLGTGTRARPLKTISVALSKLTPDKRRVYVCEGRYDEDLHLRAEHAGLVLAGGMDCSWQPDGSRPVIGSASSSSPTPIVIDAVEQPITLDSIEARSADVPTASNLDGRARSSVVARVRGAAIFRNVKLIAGRGADGAPGSDGKPRVYVGIPVDPDANPSGTKGGRVSCEDGISQGGDAPGGSGLPLGATNGGIGTACNAGGTGAAGLSGDDGPFPGFGAADFGVASYAGDGSEVELLPADGLDGRNGALGQGGGAGGGADGAGGGAGGCGGGRGRGGSGGGGSIAILAWDAKVVVVASLLETAAGGAGGPGGKGAAGTPGQDPATSSGCAGGKGGSGGRGTGGGGGAGGVSIGVLYTGNAPEVDDATAVAMKLGPAGAGGADSDGNIPGVYGARAPVLMIARAQQ